MLFGLAEASATFQQMIEEVLASIPEAQTFINNISMGVLTFESLLATLDWVLERLHLHNLHLLQKKCIVFINKVNLLGIIIFNQGISVDPKQLADIQCIPELSNVQQVQFLLGVFRFCWNFIPRYAEIAMPLYLLLKKNQLF